MERQEIIELIQQEIKTSAVTAQYSVARSPVHYHNNIDTPNLSPHSVVGFETLNGVPNGVSNPAVLNGQALSFGDTPNTTTTTPNVYIYPLPIIYGFGTTSSLTMTGTPSIGAISATLTGNFTGTTGQYAVQFVSTEVRIVTLTHSATSVTWIQPLLTGAAGTALSLIGNARFHGGIAPYGTALIFRNDDDGILQLWVRSMPQSLSESWSGVDLGGTGLSIYT